MHIRRIVHIGLLGPLFVLSIACLCQLVPGQAVPVGPQLLLFSGAHHPVDAGMSDDALMALAAATGQAVSVTDEGDVTIGYDAPPALDTTLCSLRRHAADEVAQNPVLNALLPDAGTALLPDDSQPVQPQHPADYRSPALLPPTRPPKVATHRA